jgi:hypothetical protein
VFESRINTRVLSDPKFHAFVNKWSAPPFRKENLIKGEPAAMRILDQFTARVKEDGPTMEVVSLFRLLALDMYESHCTFLGDG